MKVSSIYLPGTEFTSEHHYAVFMSGITPVTRYSREPFLIDAETGQFAGKVGMNWLAKVLLLSQPLHFGDYGGLSFKIVWALLDVMAIIVLFSGLYLWVTKP